jgi:hypothetical protein
LLRSEILLIGEGQPPATYTVRLYFMTLENDQPGQRVGDVKLQDRVVMEKLDVVARAGGAKRAFTAEFKDIPVSGELVVELVPQVKRPDADQQPLLSGIEVVRTGAREIIERVAARAP